VKTVSLIIYLPTIPPSHHVSLLPPDPPTNLLPYDPRILPFLPHS
jgi:hypothetical protein